MAQTIRKIYCPVCDSMEEHSITQHGTKQKTDGVYVKFLHDCQRCRERWKLGVLKHCIVGQSCIPVKDYNALIQKEIFAK